MQQYRWAAVGMWIVVLPWLPSINQATAQTVTQILDASGDGSHGLDCPQDMTIDGSGNVYVVGYSSNNVFKITPDGDVTEIIDATGDGDPGDGLTNPYGIAVDGSGNVYVSGANSNNVFKITPGGVITEIIDYVYHPHGIAVDASGNVFLAMPDGSYALKVTPEGAMTEIIAGWWSGITLKTPTSIASDGSGNVYVAGLGSDNVFKITPGGDIAEIINRSGDGVHLLTGPWFLAVDDADNVYVSGHSSDNVFRITPEGVKTLIIDINGDPDPDNRLKSPRGIAIDDSGNVYVAGNSTSNAFKITPGGDITEIISAAGDGVHPLQYAYGIAVDSSGSVYVSGHGSDNVFKVTSGTAPTNSPPVANASGPYTGEEGSEVTFDGAGSSDPDGGALTCVWDFGDGSTGSGATATHAYADNGVYTVSLTVTDPAGASSTQETTATIANVAPTVGPIAAPADPVRLGSGDVSATAEFVDMGEADTHTAQWDWGDGTIDPGTVDEAYGFGSATGRHAYAEAGIYTITLTVTDDDGDSGGSQFQYVVVYDPSGGFVTGGGWIDSPAGAYKPDPALAGKANFGFVSKYKKGASTPTGQTEFVFQAGDLNFHSSSYDWLVVTGSHFARFKGSGTINGSGCYKFMLWAGDDPDTFRIRIWTEDASGLETDVYDNGMDQSIGGGSIVIHTN